MKHWLKNRLPDRRALLANTTLQRFAHLLVDPNLWHFNRRSVAGAMALGLFAMYIPSVGQMFIGAALAIKWRVNLPLTVALTWVTNPITSPPMFYFAYLVGCWLLGHTAQGMEMSFWLDWHNWLGVLEPFLLGCFVCASVSAALGYAIVITAWRWHLIQHLRQRKARYSAGVRTPSSKRHT